MPMVQQRAEGIVAVRNDEGNYIDLSANFEADNGAALPALPEGITERIYEAGKRHALVKGTDVVDGGPLPWPEGDAVLAKNKELLEKKKVRDEVIAVEARRKLETEVAGARAQLQAQLEAQKQ